MKSFYCLAIAFSALATPAAAGIWQHTEDFELADSSKTGWFAGPGAGFDFQKKPGP